MREKTAEKLSGKRKYVGEETKIYVDSETGEIIKQKRQLVFRNEKKESFGKIDARGTNAGGYIDDISLGFAAKIIERMEWSNNGAPQYITLTKRAKEELAGQCGKTQRQVERDIKAAVDCGLLFQTEFRGIYEVNPWMLSKGESGSINKLKGRFVLDENNKWVRVCETEG